MTNGDAGQKQVKTTHTTFDILEFVQENQGASTGAVAAELELAESTAHRHLSTLLDRGYLIKDGHQYDISSRFLKLGEYASRRTENYEVAQAVVDEVANETGEQAHFFIQEHGWAIQIHTRGGEHAVNSGPGRGYRLPLHSTAAGKAILAHQPEMWVDDLLESRTLSSVIENTITDTEMLKDELATIRERGYSKTSEEHVHGINAIGVPVVDPQGGLLGAISVSGPTRRLSDNEGEIGEYLIGRANELELNIGFSSGTKETRTADKL